MAQCSLLSDFVNLFSQSNSFQRNTSTNFETRMIADKLFSEVEVDRFILCHSLQRGLRSNVVKVKAADRGTALNVPHQVNEHSRQSPKRHWRNVDFLFGRKC